MARTQITLKAKMIRTSFQKFFNSDIECQIGCFLINLIHCKESQLQKEELAQGLGKSQNSCQQIASLKLKEVLERSKSIPGNDGHKVQHITQRNDTPYLILYTFVQKPVALPTALILWIVLFYLLFTRLSHSPSKTIKSLRSGFITTVSFYLTLRHVAITQYLLPKTEN